MYCCNCSRYQLFCTLHPCWWRSSPPADCSGLLWTSHHGLPSLLQLHRSGPPHGPCLAMGFPCGTGIKTGENVPIWVQFLGLVTPGKMTTKALAFRPYTCWHCAHKVECPLSVVVWIFCCTSFRPGAPAPCGSLSGAPQHLSSSSVPA